MQELYFRTWKDSLGHQCMIVEMGSFEPIADRIEWLRAIGDAHSSGPEIRARLIAELEGLAASGYTHVSVYTGNAWFELEWAPYRVVPGTPAAGWCEAMVRFPRFRTSLLGSVKLYQRVDRLLCRRAQTYYSAWCDPTLVLATLGRMRATRCFAVQAEHSSWVVLRAGDKPLTQYELTP